MSTRGSKGIKLGKGIWKKVPSLVKKLSIKHIRSEVRASTTRLWKDQAKYKNSNESFTIDTAKLWNKVNSDMKNAETCIKAKSFIKTFCKTLETLKYIINFSPILNHARHGYPIIMHFNSYQILFSNNIIHDCNQNSHFFKAAMLTRSK